MQIPHFPESNHPLVKSLFHNSDQELINLFGQHPDAGRYFTAIFCRYSPIVYTLIMHSARSPVQADYLFAMTWKHIYYQVGGVNLESSEPDANAKNLQNCLTNMKAYFKKEKDLQTTESNQ